MTAGARGTSGPARVRHNDWRAAAPAAQGLDPALTVSVVIPSFDAGEALALTLAALERQDWPRGRLEVVVVDDGSEPPLALPAGTPLAVRLVRREGRGFSLAAARNAGARAAGGDILVFLDADMIAEAGLVGAHARWQHALGCALTLGFRACVSAAGIDARAVRGRAGTVGALLAGRAVDPPWQERLMIATGDLTAGREDLFRAAAGNNLGIGRALFEETGGFDGSFDRYGGEDTEFAYRAQVRGAVLVPVREALAWHQGRWDERRVARRDDLDRQRAKLADRIAVPGFRRGFAVPPGGFTVPRHAVMLEAGDASAGLVARAARGLLADARGDAAVLVEAPAGGGAGDRADLESALGADSRARIAAQPDTLDAFPHSPLHLTVPVAAVRPGLLGDLAHALGNRAAVKVRLDDGTKVLAARAWALHRARRAGVDVSEFGDTGEVALKAPGGLRRLARCLDPAARARQAMAGVDRGPAWVRHGREDLARVLAEAGHVRDPRSAWRFLRWLWGGIVWRLRHGR